MGPAVPDHDDPAAQVLEEVDDLPGVEVAAWLGGEVKAEASASGGESDGPDDADLIAMAAPRFEDGGLPLRGPSASDEGIEDTIGPADQARATTYGSVGCCSDRRWPTTAPEIRKAMRGMSRQPVVRGVCT